jgi:hypothetical protein
MTSRTRRASTRTGRSTYTAGPFKGVRDTTDPYDDPPDLLVEAVNTYIPDPQGGSGVYARPGFQLLNGGAAIYANATPFRGQGIYTHTQLDGSTISFIAMGGRLFRANDTYTTFTDVTPVGITIDSALNTRVDFISLIGNLEISDGVNRPWIASNLTSTPITGTYIDYDGVGGSWSSKKPFLYGGSIFHPLKQVNGIGRGVDFSWCEPGQPTVGFQQANYDDNWTLTNSNAGIIYAGAGTNSGFFYWRAGSIGTANGPVGPTLASSATEDSVAFNVGTQAAQTIQQFGNSFFFCDAIGRPWRFVPGTPPEPIWLQMRAQVSQSTVGNPATTSIVATSVIEPTLNLYLVGIWSPTPSTQTPVTRLYVFDARTGTYLGYWVLGPGIGIDCIGSFTDAGGRVTIIVLGSKAASPATNGYVWAFNSVATVPQDLTTENSILLTTEDGVVLTTEGEAQSWLDNGQIPTISATTGRFGYEADTVHNVDSGTIITLTDAPVRVSIQTSAVASTVEGIPEPSASQDGTYRLPLGCDIVGRGPQVTVSPLSADEQWSLQSVSLVTVASMAGAEDA